MKSFSPVFRQAENIYCLKWREVFFFSSESTGIQWGLSGVHSGTVSSEEVYLLQEERQRAVLLPPRHLSPLLVLFNQPSCSLSLYLRFHSRCVRSQLFLWPPPHNPSPPTTSNPPPPPLSTPLPPCHTRSGNPKHHQHPGETSGSFSFTPAKSTEGK